MHIRDQILSIETRADQSSQIQTKVFGKCFPAPFNVYLLDIVFRRRWFLLGIVFFAKKTWKLQILCGARKRVCCNYPFASLIKMIKYIKRAIL